MEPPEGVAAEKRRVAKPALFVLLSVIFKRYSTAAISCKLCVIEFELPMKL